MSVEHHTKNKGDLGNLKAQVRMAELGFVILIPITEHQPFDFVAYKDGNFYTIQAKYRSIRNGCLQVVLKTSWSDKHGIHEKPIDRNIIDFISIYCPEIDKVYFANLNDFKHLKSINLRVENPKNNQIKNINFANEFEIPKM